MNAKTTIPIMKRLISVPTVKGCIVQTVRQSGIVMVQDVMLTIVLAVKSSLHVLILNVALFYVMNAFQLHAPIVAVSGVRTVKISTD